MREDYRPESKPKLSQAAKEFWETTRKGLRFVRGSRAMRFAIMMATIQCFAVQTANMHWQPLLKPFVGSQTELGWVAVAVRVVLIFGAFLATRSEKFMSDRRLMFAAHLIIGIGLASVYPAAGSMVAVVPFLIHELGRGVYKPVLNGFMNANFAGKERATVLSLQTMGEHVGGAIGLLVSGYLARTYLIPVTWLAMGITLIIGTFVLTWNRKRG